MKIKKFLILLTLFMVLLCSVSAISAAPDNTVDNLTSEIDSGVDSISVKSDEKAIGVDDYSALIAQKETILTEITVENKTFADIQNAIDSSQPNDTIELEGIYTGNGSKIKIPFHELTFVGANGGATLDARNLSEIIYSNAPTVTFKNINFINGNTVGELSFYRSVIHAQGKLVLENCSMTDNHITKDDINCLIYSRSSVSMTNSTFSNNAYYHNLMNVVDCRIDNCSIVNNIFYSKEKGVIHFRQSIYRQFQIQ